MKQTMTFCADEAGQSVVESISREMLVYTQAVWRLGTRYVSKRMGLRVKSKRRSQARYEQKPPASSGAGLTRAIHSTTGGVQRTVSKVHAVKTTSDLPAGVLTEICSFSDIGDQLGESLYAVNQPQCSSSKWQQELKPILPALSGFCQQRWLVLLAPPCIPTTEELSAVGIDPARVLLVHANNRNSLTVLEQALRSGTCGAVLAWLENSDSQSLHRLQQAARAGNAWGVLFRAPRQGNAQLEIAID